MVHKSKGIRMIQGIFEIAQAISLAKLFNDLKMCATHESQEYVISRIFENAQSSINRKDLEACIKSIINGNIDEIGTYHLQSIESLKLSIENT